ncbi:MAG: hypothetical protein M9933_03665 [Chitinophagaceae bacterium]|nr:hypothetical protein [Chitinophagaceae bacterium]
MKAVFTLLIMIVSAGIAEAQTGTYHYISNQQEQLKYDSLNKLYFVDSEFRKASGIRIENNMISLTTPDNSSSSIYINNEDLGSLQKKESFTIEGRDSRSGQQVKLGFWFIAGVLEEVSYTIESNRFSIAYKDISDNTEADGRTIAYAYSSEK